MQNIEIEIGEELFLRIEFATYRPATEGRVSDIPERCYEGECASLEFDDEDVKIVRYLRVYSSNPKRTDDPNRWVHREMEHVFKAPPYFASMYMTELYDKAKEKFEEESYDR